MEEQGHPTPEDAVLAEWEGSLRQFVTVVGSRIKGDEATVWLLTNDREPFEEYECVCVREGGSWRESHGSGGFSPLTTPREVKDRAAETKSHSRAA